MLKKSPLLPLAIALLAPVVFGFAPTGQASAIGSSLVRVSDTSLGVSLVIPKGLVRLTRVPTSEIDIARPGGGESGYLRFVIRAFEMTPRMSVQKAEWRASSDLISGFPHHGTLARRRTTIAGTPTLMIRGLPPTPQPAADVLLVYRNPGHRLSANRAVYLIVLPGRTVDRAQREILSTLTFIPRTQFFPCPPTLSVSPNPIRLGRPLSVVLSCVRPNHTYGFVTSPLKPGFGGGNMGDHRTGAYGLASFTYPAFERSWELGRWVVDVYDDRDGKRVAQASVFVRRGRLR